MSEKLKDRHSNMAVDGKPKKGGAGKGGWGKGGLDDLGELKTSVNDPNYISEEEEGEIEYETKGLVNSKASPMTAILQDYFSSGDVKEAGKSIREAGLDGDYPTFLRKAMIYAMEKSSYEKELVSQLFSALSTTEITPNGYSECFQTCLDKLEELTIDIPQAGEMLSKFLARAIVDEVLPPAFPKTCDLASLKAEECVTLVTSLIKDKHRYKILAHIWGPGDLGSIKRLKEESETILKEFILTGDLEEADRCLRRLNVPSFHYQLVKQAVRIAVTRGEKEAKNMEKLVKFYNETGLISNEQVEKGLRCVEEALDDIKLDAPNAPKAFSEFKWK